MLNDSQQTGIRLLRDKCLLYNKFIIDKGGLPAALVQIVMESDKVIETAYLKNDIKRLKAMSADIDDEVLRQMSLSMAQEIRRLFLDKLNIDYDEEGSARTKIIEDIFKKGNISTPDEYELLLNRIDEIYADPSKAEEVQRINDILAAYHR